MGDVIGGIVERVVCEAFKMYELNVVGRLGIVKGGTERAELCLNERIVRRTSIPDSQRDEPGRGGIDHRVEARRLLWAGQMSFGDSSATRGI